MENTLSTQLDKLFEEKIVLAREEIKKKDNRLMSKLNKNKHKNIKLKADMKLPVSKD